MQILKMAVTLMCFSQATDELSFQYLYPQESGNHCQTKWAIFKSDDQLVLKFQGNHSFNFSVHSYSAAAIDSAQHIHELKKQTAIICTSIINSTGLVPEAVVRMY